MITLHLKPTDLSGMRFAYRPLLEVVLSYRVLNNPSFQSPFLHWVDEARYALHEVDLPYLAALVSPAGYIPDFLTPTPMSNRTNIEDDFSDLLATPDDLIRQDMLTMIEEHGDSHMRRYI